MGTITYAYSVKKKQPTKKLSLAELALRFEKELSGKEVSQLTLDQLILEIYGRLDLAKAKEEKLNTDNKDTILKIRVSQQEREALKRCVEKEGTTMSELIRGRLPELKSA